eukprot:13531802-Ditylum_brightwellii.AAC.1
MEQVATMLKKEGKTDGAVMCEEDGPLLSAANLEDEFHAQLQKIQTSQTSHPRLIDTNVDVTEVYGISRSLRRGSNTRATNQ